MSNKHTVTLLTAVSFCIGVAVGAAFMKTLFLSSEKIEAIAEKRATERFEAFVSAIENRSALFRDSLTKREKERLIFEYKRIITSDDTEISKRVDAILDSMYSVDK